MTRRYLIPYEITENDRYITYSTELWNYIDDGIIVVYDKEQQQYTDDFQTEFELACLGYDTNKKHKYVEQVKRLADLKYQHVNEINNTFEIVSRKGLRPNDKNQIYLNALAQYIILEVFRAKRVLEG